MCYRNKLLSLDRLDSATFGPASGRLRKQWATRTVFRKCLLDNYVADITLTATTLCSLKGRELTHVRDTDTFDPVENYGPDEISEDAARRLWGIDPTYSSPLLLPPNAFDTGDELDRDLDRYLTDWDFDKYFTEPPSRPLSSSSHAVSGPPFEIGDSRESDIGRDTFQVPSTAPGSNPAPRDRIGSSSSVTLSGSGGSSKTANTPEKSPRFRASNGTLQSPLSDNTPDTCQKPALEYCIQQWGSRGRQENCHPSPLSRTEIRESSSETAFSIGYTTSPEKGSSLHLRESAVTKNVEASHSDIPGCRILNFFGTDNSKIESANKRKISSSVQGRRTSQNPKRRAQHGAICVRCKLFREGVCTPTPFAI